MKRMFTNIITIPIFFITMFIFWVKYGKGWWDVFEKEVHTTKKNMDRRLNWRK